ncbi:hypothetical protein ACJX0J_023366, partial [Zea mays]
ALLAFTDSFLQSVALIMMIHSSFDKITFSVILFINAFLFLFLSTKWSQGSAHFFTELGIFIAFLL